MAERPQLDGTVGRAGRHELFHARERLGQAPHDDPQRWRPQGPSGIQHEWQCVHQPPAIRINRQRSRQLEQLGADFAVRPGSDQVAELPQDNQLITLR